MDSDSDTDFYSETSIRRKLQKLVKCANGNRSINTPIQNISLVSDSVFDSSGVGEMDLEETIKVLFPEEPLKIHRFTVQRTDSLAPVFKQLSEIKSVPFDFIGLILMPLNRDVSQFDSLESLNFTSLHYFKAYLKSSNALYLDSKGTGDIEIKCVTPNRKMVYKMYQDQPLDILIGYCARDLNCDKNDFKLIFDGEIIRPFHTCSSLEISNGETIEIHFLS